MLVAKKIVLTTLRILMISALLFIVVWVLATGSQPIQSAMNSSPWPPVFWLILSCLLYTLVLALPFAPGMELGLLIMAVFGLPGVLGAWLATILGLTVAYIVGRAFRTTPFVSRLRDRWQTANPPKSIAKALGLLQKMPYLALALLINMPGNTLLGGGGGISMSLGAFGLLKLRYFIPTVALATCVIPLFVATGVALSPR